MDNNLKIPKLETIKSAAKLVNLTKYHIRQLVLQKKIKYIRSGTKYLINFQSLLYYLNTRDDEIATDSVD